MLSTFAQQQHQKNNPGSSGSGSGGAAPQRTVQVDAISTTASAPAVPSAAAPGAMPAAAPGVSAVSDAWKLRPWSDGWLAYPPAVPFESSGASPPAQLAVCFCFFICKKRVFAYTTVGFVQYKTVGVIY